MQLAAYFNLRISGFPIPLLLALSFIVNPWFVRLSVAPLLNLHSWSHSQAIARIPFRLLIAAFAVRLNILHCPKLLREPRRENPGPVHIQMKTDRKSVV